MRTTLSLTLILLCLVIAMSAKPVLEIKQLISFSVAEPSFDPSFTYFCITDSLIIAVDNADSTNHKTYCYDFNGNKVEAFKLPTVPKYRQPFFIRYLFGRKQIAIQAWGDIDFLSIYGDSLDHKDRIDDQTIFVGTATYLDAVEFGKEMYYRYWKAVEAGVRNDIITSSVTWFKDAEDDMIWPMRKIYSDRNFPIPRNEKTVLPNWYFLLDTNTNKQMAMVEEAKDEYIVKFFPDSLTYKFNIKRHKNDHLNFMHAGENYVVLVTVDDNYKQTNTAGIYDLTGKKIQSLNKLNEFYNEDVDIGIKDIVGNKAFVLNAEDKTMTIYEVSLKD